MYVWPTRKRNVGPKGRRGHFWWRLTSRHRELYYCLPVRLYAQLLENHLVRPIYRKQEVEIWPKHAQSTFRTRLTIRLL